MLTSADLTNIETGLSVRESLGERWDDVPVVLPVFDRELARMMEQSFGFQHVRSTSALAAPWFVGAALGLDVLSTFYVDQQPFLVAGLTVAPTGGLQGLAMQDLSARTRVIALSRAGGGALEHPPRRGTVFAGGRPCVPARPLRGAAPGPPAGPDARVATPPGIMVRRDHASRRYRPARPRLATGSPPLPGRGSARGPSWPWRSAWGLWELRPELRAVPYLDDSSLHQQMVRVAASPDPPGPPAPRRAGSPTSDWARRSSCTTRACPSMIAGADRHRRRPRHRVPLVALPPARPVAARGVLERPALRPQPVDRRRGGRGVAVPLVGGRHRLRDQGLRLGGVRRVDPALGLVDASVGVGLHLPGAALPAPRASRPSSSSC